MIFSHWNKATITGSLAAVGGVAVFSILFGSKIKRYLSGSASDITAEALADPKVKEQADDLVQHTLQNPENKKLLTDVVLETISDESVIKTTTKSLNKIIKSSKVQNNLNNLLLNACMETLNKEQINQRINQRLMLLIQDADLQQQTGDHLYNAARYVLVTKLAIPLVYLTLLILFFGIIYLYFQT